MWHYTGAGNWTQARAYDPEETTLSAWINKPWPNRSTPPSLTKSGAVVVRGEVYVGFGTGGLNSGME